MMVNLLRFDHPKYYLRDEFVKLEVDPDVNFDEIYNPFLAAGVAFLVVVCDWTGFDEGFDATTRGYIIEDQQDLDAVRADPQWKVIGFIILPVTVRYQFTRPQPEPQA
jgi:hypothetical protein